MAKTKKRRKPGSKASIKNQNKTIKLKLPNGGMVIKGVLMSVCYILNKEFGFGVERQSRLVNAVYQFWLTEERNNDTVIDELQAWCDKEGLNI